jgi:acetyl-CoA acyltransferase
MEAYIIKGLRTAVGKAKKGGFRFTRSDDLAVEVIKNLVNSIEGLRPEMIDDIIVGCANPEGEQGLQIGRQIALRALGKEVPGFTINRYCASGLESIGLATAKIKAGMGHCYIAGGAESMSLIPMTGYKLAPSFEVARENPEYVVSMGLTAEAVAGKYHISREEQDAFAERSHKLAHQAQVKGYFQSSILPIAVEEVVFSEGERRTHHWVVDTDEGVRPDTTVAKLSQLKPAFAREGSVTAGNSSQTSDGAAFVVVMSEELMQTLGLQPAGKLLAYAAAGVDPLHMGIGPVAAIPKALAMAKLELSSIDLIELNEAFAAQSLAVIKEAGLDLERTNVNGGAIALGHPLGCTGAKLTIQILDELKRRGQKFGMVTACVGGGQGIAGILEAY